MTENDLLRAIQTTDGAFFDEAAEREMYPKMYTGKRKCIPAICVTIAAVFILTAAAGFIFGKKDGLTESASASSAQIVDQSAENFFGGHGSIRYGVNGKVLRDDEKWYISSTSAKMSDEPYIPIQYNDLSDRLRALKKGATGWLLYDLTGNHQIFLFDRNAMQIDRVSESGKRTEIFSLYKMCPDLKLDKQGNDNGVFEVQHIAHLSGSSYFIDGFYASSSESHYFRCVFDAENQSCQKFEFEQGQGSTASRIASDGDSGVWLDETAHENGVYVIHHCNADNLEGTALQIKVKPYAWFLNGGSIYYVEPDTNDYCRYDLSTCENKCLAAGDELAWEQILFKDGVIVTCQGNCLYINTPDLTAQETAELPFDNLCLLDICDDTVFMSCPENTDFHGYILFNLKTKQTKYLFDPETDKLPVDLIQS